MLATPQSVVSLAQFTIFSTPVTDVRLGIFSSFNAPRSVKARSAPTFTRSLHEIVVRAGIFVNCATRLVVDSVSISMLAIIGRFVNVLDIANMRASSHVLYSEAVGFKGWLLLVSGLALCVAQGRA